MNSAQSFGISGVRSHSFALPVRIRSAHLGMVQKNSYSYVRTVPPISKVFVHGL